MSLKHPPLPQRWEKVHWTLNQTVQICPNIRTTWRHGILPPKEEMPAAPARQQTSAAEDTPEQLGFDVQEGPAPLRYVGEIFKTYILAERGEEICIIDKHAAHERQLFEKLAANYGDVPAQLLLEPLVVELSAEEKTALLSNLAAAGKRRTGDR